MRLLVAALAAWLAIAPVASAKPAYPKALDEAPSPQQPGTEPAGKVVGLVHLPRLRAAEPVWIAGQGMVCFLGYGGAGAPDVDVWDPLKKRVGRASDGKLMRHSLAAAGDGRVAYVEQDPTALAFAPPPDGDYAAGQDRIKVYDFVHGSTRTVFAGGTVAPRSLCWSRDGSRLAFLLAGNDSQQHLALLESGKPLVVTHMPVPYQLNRLVGWIGDHEVMAEATTPQGAPILLRVGQSGFSPLPAGNDPKLSPDGRLLLARSSARLGVLLRGAAGGGHTFSRVCSCYAWNGNAGVFLQVGSDVLMADLSGKVQRRYPKVAPGELIAMVASPDGKYLALLSTRDLSVLPL